MTDKVCSDCKNLKLCRYAPAVLVALMSITHIFPQVREVAFNWEDVAKVCKFYKEMPKSASSINSKGVI